MTQVGGTKARGRRRSHVPMAMRGQVLCESGYRCSIPGCPRQDGLELHHINGDPDDQRPANLLVLCSMHHCLTRVRGSKLHPKACRELKGALTRFSAPMVVGHRTLEATWARLQAHGGGRAKREDQFEFLVGGLLACIPGLVVGEKRASRTTGEVDILLRNDSADPFFRRLAPEIVVACHLDCRQFVPGPTVARFVGSMALNGWSAAFLVALRGFAPSAVAVADTVSGNDLFIALMGPPEVAELIASDDRAETIMQLVRRFRRRPRGG